MRTPHRRYLPLFALAALLLPVGAHAQGGIGPLPFANPAVLSPAFGGLVEGTFALDFSHRIRAATPDDDFVTSVLSVDYPYYSEKLKGGIGALVNLDQAGGLLRTDAQLQLAWEAPLGRKVRYDHLRAGVSVGFLQLRVDQAQLVYADQFVALSGSFTGPTADPVALAGQSTNAALDVGIGVIYYRTQKIVGNPEFNYYAGFGYHHLNRPKLAFFESDSDDDLRLSPRLNVFGGIKYRLRSPIDLNANFVFQDQNSSQILQLGLFARTVFFEEGKLFGIESAALFAGINGRLELGSVPAGQGVIGEGVQRSGLQSITPFIGFEFAKTFNLAVASDIITADESSLLNSSYGGVQFMLSYIIGGKKYNRPALPFPIF